MPNYNDQALSSNNSPADRCWILVESWVWWLKHETLHDDSIMYVEWFKLWTPTWKFKMADIFKMAATHLKLWYPTREKIF